MQNVSTDDGPWSRVEWVWKKLRSRFEGVQSVLKDALDGDWQRLNERFQGRLNGLGQFRQSPGMWYRALDLAQEMLDALQRYAEAKYQQLEFCSLTFKRAMAEVLQALVTVRDELAGTISVSDPQRQLEAVS